MKELFWNLNEARLRAFWRIAILVILFAALSLCLGTPLILLVMGVIVAQSGMDTNELIASLQGHPIFLGLNGVLSLVIALLCIWLVGRFIDRRRLASFGFHFDTRWWLDLGFGLLLGAALMVFIFIVERAMGWITVTGTAQTTVRGLNFPIAILIQVVAYVAVGIYEELLFRGYLIKNMSEGLNVSALRSRGALLVTWAVTSLAFGLAHALNPNSTLVSTVTLTLAGLFLGLGYLFTGELAIPIGLHITWNFFQGNVFGFPVSGNPTGTSFILVEQGGPATWTGGAFGPEAGLIGLVAMLLGTLLTLLWVRVNRGGVRLRAELAEYTLAEPAPTELSG